MDGLEDRAEAGLADLIQQLYVNEVVEVKHSSRDTVMLRITEELKNPKTTDMITVKSLILRSGISVGGLRMLQQALAQNKTIEAIEFYCLQNVEVLRLAMECCKHQTRIRRLGLKSFSPITSRRAGQGRELIASTIRDVVFGPPQFTDDDTTNEARGIPTLETLEIVNYPIGTEAMQILADSIAQNKTLRNLKLMDCDLRSDTAKSIAHMIRANTTLTEIDLSYNRYHLGSEITRELALKTLVQRGLRFNMTLQNFKMNQTSGQGSKLNRSKIDRQLAISRFRRKYETESGDPFQVPPLVWPRILARASQKPSALHLFVHDCAVTLFR